MFFCAEHARPTSNFLIGDILSLYLPSLSAFYVASGLFRAVLLHSDVKFTNTYHCMLHLAFSISFASLEAIRSTLEVFSCVPAQKLVPSLCASPHLKSFAFLFGMGDAPMLSGFWTFAMSSTLPIWVCDRPLARDPCLASPRD